MGKRALDRELQELLEQCRQNFGAAPRRFNLQQRFYHAAAMPPWVMQDSIKGIYQQRSKILRHGAVVWGHIVQANAQLYHAFASDSPACAVYNSDPTFDEPTNLSEIAHKIYELKGTKPDDTQLFRIAASITNEMSRNAREPVPFAIAGNNNTFVATIMVHRKHLPFGYLSTRTLPLVIAPQHSPWSLILPSHYWPADLRDRY